ncbi:Protein kinase superfamily protein [Euphorbia peplus]|nr:Protein kinase superfamily protein [Euphorbia peplus]
MRNAFRALRRHRHCRTTLLSSTLYHDANALRILRSCTSLAQKEIEIRKRQDNLFLPYLFCRRFSTTFTSVHGGRPSSEYAKLRKESLESEFGQALGTHSSERVSVVYRFGPFLAVYRAAFISFYVFKLALWQIFVRDINKRAIKFRETLIQLGPFYIKLGQALSTRPDILPSVYCQELVKLQDQIPPFPTNVAIKSIESQLGVPVSRIFTDISPEPIAAASLGQVYKAHLHSGELVAVKVQRPGMSQLLTLDALLFKMIGGQLKRFAKARKDLLVAVNEMVRHMFDEIDYVLEGKNAERFASLYGLIPCNDTKGNQKAGLGRTIHNEKENRVKVPKIYWDMTRKGVLTMEWIDGIKLTDEEGLEKACLDPRKLIDQGVYCSLRQLLQVGYFHADPHPGNLVATKSGSLAYFDFGMMGDIPRHFRVGLIRVLVHFVNRDSLGLANDFLSLGFIPEGVDIQSVSVALQRSFGDGTRQSRDFEAIMNQLYDIMYEFDFSLPPDYALVIRALGSLEGTAKVLDPNFKVVESAYPFVIGRLLADADPDMRRILRELLIRNDGSVRWNRLERLVAAISEQASESSGDESTSEESNSNAYAWKSFDMRSVVSATEDLFLFILSEKGWRVRVFLVRDIIKVVDVIFEDEINCCTSDEKGYAREASDSEGHSMYLRVVDGFHHLRQAVKLAPDMWTAMLIRMALRPEFHGFTGDVISAISFRFSHKFPEKFWFCMSRLLHMSERNHKFDDL